MNETHGCRIPDPQFRIALIIWIVIAFVCAALAVSKPKSHTIYPIFSFAAGEWVAGRDIHVKLPGYDYYRYSPTVAAFFVPWRLLGDAWGGALWRLLGVGLLVAGLLAWSRYVWQRRRSMEQLGWLFVLITPFLLQNIHNGQSNPHMLGMLLLGTSNAAMGRTWWSVAWFAMAALFKPYVLAIALLLALVDRRLWIRLTVALTIAVGVSFLCQAPSYVAGQYSAWFRHLAANDRGALPLRDSYRDVGLLFRAYIVQLPPMAPLIISAVVGLVMAWLVWRGTKTNRSRLEQIGVAFAMGSCWVTVFGPATESCTYLLLAPALAAAVLARPGHSGRWVRISYATFVGTITASLFPQEWRVQVWGPQPLAGLIFLFVVVGEAMAVRPNKRQFESSHLSAAA